MATHRQPTADEQPGGKRCETYRRILHKSKHASISGNNHGLVCTNETVSMSVCIHIKGFEGKWWQGKTILCIPNKASSCFRWQRLADLCHLFWQEQRKWMQRQRINRKNLHPENRKWLLSMARFTDGIAQRSVYNLLRNSVNIKAPAVSPLVLYDSEW